MKTVLWCVLSTAIWLSTCQSPATAQIEQWQTDFVPNDTFCSVNFNVLRLLTASESLPETEPLKLMLESTFDLELSDVEQFQVFYGGEREEFRGDDDFLHTHLTFKAERDFNAQSAGELLSFYRLEDATYRDRAYFENANVADSWSAMSVSDRSILFALTPRIHKLIDSGDSISSFAQSLERVTTDAEVVITLSTNYSAKLVATNLFGVGLAGCFEHFDSGVIIFDVQSDTPVTATFSTADEQQALLLENKLKQAIETGQSYVNEHLALLNERRAQMEEEDFEIPEEFMLQLNTYRLILAVINSMKLTNTGNGLIVAIEKEQGGPQLLSALCELVSSG